MLKRKEKILISALELLDEKGVAGVTTRNLAEKEGVSEPALYRQFKDKQAIIDRILVEFFSYDEKIENTILEMDMPLKEAIFFYLERYGELYQNYSELSAVPFSMDLYFYNEENQRYFKAQMDSRHTFLANLIGGKDYKSTFKRDLSPEDFAEEILGLLSYQTYLWRMNRKEGILRERLIKHLEGWINIL